MLTVVEVPVADLKEAEYNPRRMTEEAAERLEASIREFGYVEPLVVNSYPGRENVIVGGHRRLDIAKRVGEKSVPCVYVSLPLGKEKELNLRLNKNVGEWDMDKLLSEFDEDLLELVGFNEKSLGLAGNEALPSAEEKPGNVSYAGVVATLKVPTESWPAVKEALDGVRELCDEVSVA